MNARDSEKLTGILEQIGYVEAEEEQADFVIYNTCTVRENANLRVYGRLGYLHSLKKKTPHDDWTLRLYDAGAAGSGKAEKELFLCKSDFLELIIFTSLQNWWFLLLVQTVWSLISGKTQIKSWKICQVKESFHLNLESILCLGAIISVAIVLYLMCEVGREAEIPRILFEKLSIW